MSYRGQTSDRPSTTSFSSLITTGSIQDSTVLQSRMSSRGQTSDRPSATSSSSPITTTDSRQDNTTGLYSRMSNRGQTSDRPSTTSFSSLITTGSIQDNTKELHSRTSSRRQNSDRPTTSSSSPITTTNSRQDKTTGLHSRMFSRGHSSDRPSATSSSSPLTTINSRQGSDLSENITSHNYGSTTVHNHMVSGIYQERSQVTKWAEIFTTPNQYTPDKKRHQSQNASPKNLLLIVVPVLLTICIILFIALVLIVMHSRKERETNMPVINEENVAMIDGGSARVGNIEENESTRTRVANLDDSFGETDV
ncbi:uncharacterized protein LOC135051088 isoform X6 [Pseudophryne corroboree]|uniref:uncharacterized protein LOC135051088 isoform X6 n=1 Tax=Pseudophryne corroboree TaxID=495146 RepID=UPI003082034E